MIAIGGMMMYLDGNQYRMIVESSPNMLWRSDSEGKCDYFNTRWLEFTGKTMEQEIGIGWATGVHPDDLEKCLKIYTEAFAKRESFTMDYRLKRYDGEWRWINDRGVAYYDDDKVFQGFIGSCMDITEQVNCELWKDMAQHDGLTGIFNRQYFEQLARVEFDNCKKEKSSLCIVMIDINHFKFINDHYGHQFGDEVIKAFAKILSENIRKTDLLGRYGGDEFILMLPNTDYEVAENLMIRIDSLLQAPILLKNDKKILISFCCGISKITEDDKMESLISKADKAMYQCKKETALKENHSIRMGAI
ncbi:MAG: sensor domain-containing diguanylate cyclase [Clostridiales bacterium]|nr:sensor domain-containing diguanylate cyclase [Clostridiales bacterium]